MNIFNKPIMLFILTVLTSAQAFAETEWMTDYNAAIKKAKDENKLIMADFTGSDWCGWCIKLDDEILNKDQFTKFAEEGKVVLFMADFPEYKSQSEKLKQQNDALKDKFNVSGFPTILFIDPVDEKIVAETGYEDVSPEEYVQKLNDIINEYKGKKKSDVNK